MHIPLFFLCFTVVQLAPQVCEPDPEPAESHGRRGDPGHLQALGPAKGAGEGAGEVPSRPHR
jgi:hypothetical protein